MTGLMATALSFAGIDLSISIKLTTELHWRQQLNVPQIAEQIRYRQIALSEVRIKMSAWGDRQPPTIDTVNRLRLAPVITICSQTMPDLAIRSRRGSRINPCLALAACKKGSE